jgi:hypothetical protein
MDVRTRSRLLTTVLAGCALVLAGCLPSACNREESRALLPTDSLSREIAAQMMPDTLRTVWQTTASASQPLEYPRTLTFGEDGHLYVADTKQGRVLMLDSTGAVVRSVREDDWSYPYLAGHRGDSIFVFHPDLHRLDVLHDGRVVRRQPTPTDLPEDALQYAAVTDGAAYLKVVSEGGDDVLARLDEQGAYAARIALPGPRWRRAGLLRTWGDSLLSLSGYRPVVDVLTADTTLDSLRLVGFDSPMLARSRAFLRGDTHEAPLLTASAAAAGDHLFVLNMRPGWLRIDVYGRDGRLRQVFTQPDPGYDKQFYPMDLAARMLDGQQVALAVAVSDPEPGVWHYRGTLRPAP